MEDESSITTENRSEEEIEIHGLQLISNAASKVWQQFKDILPTLPKDHDDSETKQKAFETITSDFAGIHVENLRWLQALKKHPVRKSMLQTKETLIN